MTFADALIATLNEHDIRHGWKVNQEGPRIKVTCSEETTMNNWEFENGGSSGSKRCRDAEELILYGITNGKPDPKSGEQLE
jgi:hypothetical protein